MVEKGPDRLARAQERASVDPPAAGAAPDRVAALLRTFSPAPAARRRRTPRPDAPGTIVPLLVVPDEGTTPLDPGRIDDARARLKARAAEEAARAAEAPVPPDAVPADPQSFDAARQRLRRTRPRSAPPRP